MSGDSHESFIKTPQQLVAAIVLFFAVTIGLALIFAQLATSGRIADDKAMSPEEVAARIKPVADAAVVSAAPGAKEARTGEQIYRSVCTACHATGVAKAPKFGDKRDWATRIREGQKALVQVVGGHFDVVRIDQAEILALVVVNLPEQDEARTPGEQALKVRAVQRLL